MTISDWFFYVVFGCTNHRERTRPLVDRLHEDYANELERHDRLTKGRPDYAKEIHQATGY